MNSEAQAEFTGPIHCPHPGEPCGTDDARPVTAIWKIRDPRAVPTVDSMFTAISITPMYVDDQDAAVTFYTEVLGFNVSADQDLPNMRWVTVCLPSDDSRHVLLQLIGDDAPTGADTARETELLHKLTERGATTWMILTAPDVDAVHSTLTDAGVEILQPPTDQPYGRDMAFADPFGNQIRVTEPPK